jgi:hypothetical protein
MSHDRREDQASVAAIMMARERRRSRKICTENTHLNYQLDIARDRLVIPTSMCTDQLTNPLLIKCI